MSEPHADALRVLLEQGYLQHKPDCAKSPAVFREGDAVGYRVPSPDTECTCGLAVLLSGLPQTPEPTEAKGGDANERGTDSLERGERSNRAHQVEGGVTHPPTNTSPVLSSPSAAPQDIEYALNAIDTLAYQMGGSPLDGKDHPNVGAIQDWTRIIREQLAAAPSGEARKAMTEQQIREEIADKLAVFRSAERNPMPLQRMTHQRQVEEFLVQLVIQATTRGLTGRLRTRRGREEGINDGHTNR